MTISSLREGRYVDVNESLLEQTGYTREEMIGRTASDVGVYVDPSDFGSVRDNSVISACCCAAGIELKSRIWSWMLVGSWAAATAATATVARTVRLRISQGAQRERRLI